MFFFVFCELQHARTRSNETVNCKVSSCTGTSFERTKYNTHLDMTQKSKEEGCLCHIRMIWMTTSIHLDVHCVTSQELIACDTCGITHEIHILLPLNVIQILIT